MSQAAAIQTAVWAQLSADGKPLPQTGQEVMGTGGYNYSATQMRSFLSGTANRLAADSPSLNFAWATLDAQVCLTDTVITLCAYIGSATS
jgi:hypothetical protein